jgi:hypothetical protein
MAKRLQRTIIVTIVETWTLIWADPDGETESVLVDEMLHDCTLLHSCRRSSTSEANTTIVSSSRITTVLPEPTSSN